MTTIASRTLTFGLGPAGTGKTYVAARMAAEAIAKSKDTKLIITRPAVEAGESLGFLPGELEEKFAPFFAPFREVLEEALGAGPVEAMIGTKRIQALPLAHMRGHTFKDAWVILDEGQNTTPGQMKLFLTRIGLRSKIIVNGDITQKDIPGRSGMVDALEALARRGVADMGVVEFDRSDIVRSGIVQEIIEAYDYVTRDSDAAPAGFWATLTKAQQEAALAYTGDETVGDADGLRHFLRAA